MVAKSLTLLARLSRVFSRLPFIRVSPFVFIGLLIGLGSLRSAAQPEVPPTPFSEDPTLVASARDSLAQVFASLVRQAIPPQYEKQKDWGRTKNVTVGLRADGLKIHRRKKPVNHGVWKHYKINLVKPEEDLQVKVDRLQMLDGGRIAFTLEISARLDCWMRAKIYQYGIHLIALEIVGDTRFQLVLNCEVAARIETAEGVPRVVIDPRVTDAKLSLHDLKLRRISNADGPLVKEFSSELREVIEDKLEGPKLTAKLNRAIDKKRKNLTLSLSDLLDSSWWPLARLPDLRRATFSR